jgi:hypothetical protein|tara:strand:+ start:793 stop:1248 length:456 start_codon:yes stop_codon:yes gene_type:complete
LGICFQTNENKNYQGIKIMKNNEEKGIRISVSVGEIFDKITILQIKQNKITDKEKLINVETELFEIKNIVNHYNNDEVVNLLVRNLKNVNLQLWEIEDKIRIKESQKEFDKEFIELARSVYIVNDKRAKIKKDINLKTNSHLVEEKSYTSY